MIYPPEQIVTFRQPQELSVRFGMVVQRGHLGHILMSSAELQLSLEVENTTGTWSKKK